MQGRVWQERRTRLIQPTQVDSVPFLVDTPVDTQVIESSPIGFAADAVPETIPASSGAVRRLVLVCAQVPAEVPPVHGRRVVLVPEPIGTPQSMQGMVVDDVDADSVAAVSQFDLTVADSEDGDLHSSPSVSPRHRLLGDSDTESLADGGSTVSIHSAVEEESQLMSFTTFEGTVWQSEKRSCLSMQLICTPSSPSEQQ